MQKVLRKRVLRNLRRHKGRYLALCLLVILGVFIVVSLLGAAQNVIDGTALFAQKNNVEDGEWETFIPLRSEQLQELTDMDTMPFSPDDLRRYLEPYAAAGYPPVSHSETYRAAYHPAYRVVKAEYLPRQTH